MAFFWFGALKCINEKVIDFFCRRNDVNRYSAHDCKLRFQDANKRNISLVSRRDSNVVDHGYVVKQPGGL